ncbi:MAG: DEAD/DEAH box helicase [Candidatus Asgardarchaeia archaeon]
MISIELYEFLSKLGIKELRDFQKEVIEKGLFEGKSFLVSAPSGSGKTLIAELASLWNVKNGRKVIYAAPYRALCNEKYERFEKLGKMFNFKAIISTGDVDTFNENAYESSDLIVCTYEKFDAMLRQNSDFLNQIGLVVIDEIHELSSERRGARLEGAIARFKQMIKVQLIALSATIENAKEIADWLGVTLIKSEYRPVPLIYKILVTNEKNSKIMEIVEKSINYGKSVIVFTSRRRDAESLALKISRIANLYMSSERKEKIVRLIENVEIDELKTHLGRKLIATILKGVAFHHAGLSYQLRRLVEQLFNKRLLNVLVGTTTLGAGVNTPASVVIVRDLVVPVRYTQLVGFEIRSGTASRFLSSNRIHQMLGRAGRPGYDTDGIGILLVSTEEEKKVATERYFEINSFKPKYERVDSQISFLDLVEQILVFITTNPGCDEEDIVKFLNHLFKYHKKSIDTISMLLKYATYEDFEKVVRAVTDIDEYNELEKIDDSKVKVYRINSQIIEGEVDGVLCGFNRYPYCYCSTFKKNINGKTLCKHTAKLILFLSKQNKILASSILESTMRDIFPVEFLIKNRFIEVRDEGKFYPTELGYLTTKLYLTPTTSFLIRKFLPEVKTLLDFLILLDKVATLEMNTMERKNMAMALLSLIKGINIIEISEKFNITLGDLEVYIDFAKWLTRVFMTIAQWLSLDEVYNIGKHILVSLENM